VSAVLGLVCVIASAVPASPAPADTGGISWSSGQPALDRLQASVRATMDENRKQLRGRTGTVRGFGAGTAYPQIWLRDSATLVPVTRFLYSREHLTSWIEEHLAHQHPDGSLNDWVAAGEPSRFTADAPHAVEVDRFPGVVLTGDRNTSESDQETSAIGAAADVFEITGDRAWLTRDVAGRRLVSRLDDALSFLLARRLDPRLGLVTSAFTADWGDVTPTYGDQRAIYLDGATPVVASLYATAMAVRAARALAGLHGALGDPDAAVRWEERGRRLADATNRHLWQADRGFYRSHLLVRWPGPEAPPAQRDDDDRFALGGNALALLYGVADDLQGRRTIASAVARARTFGMPTISGVLLPSYPPGFFRHPILRDAYAYQNGGQWDWFGGRFVLAAFQRGEAVVARRELGRIAEQAARNGGLFEWSTREGQGKGSPAYAGSAGALGAAILQGLYGIALRHDGLDLHVRLGTESGRVRVQQPATGTVVAYEYAFDAPRRAIRLRFESSVPGAGRLEILLPPATRTVRGRLDGGPTRTLEVRRRGHDSYAVLDTDWSPHRLELALR
jgi:hypothetical protein